MSINSQKEKENNPKRTVQEESIAGEEQKNSAVKPTKEQKSSAVKPTEEQKSSAVKPTEEQKSSAVKPTEEQKSSAIKPVEEKNEQNALNEELLKSNDRFMRLAAEFDNYKKRQKQEIEFKKKYSNENIAKNLFNVTDSLERALDHVEKKETANIEDFIKGIRLVHQQLVDVFKQHHIQKMDALGNVFDPEKHEAVGTVETDEVKPNKIISVFKAGYLLHERVIRPAMVQVSKSKIIKSNLE